MVTRLYALAVVVLVLAAVAVCIPVLVGIVRDAGGPRGWGTDEEHGGPGPVTEGAGEETGLPDEPPERVVCGTCGAPNEDGYAYCRNCTERL